MDVELVLVEPLGFQIDEKKVRRAGLDYWPWINLTIAPHWEEAFREVKRPWFFSVHTHRPYTEALYEEGDALVFGSENDGLPAELLAKYPDSQRLCIPMTNPNVRSLNLAQCAAVGLCEARRQVGWPPHRVRPRSPSP